MNKPAFKQPAKGNRRQTIAACCLLVIASLMETQASDTQDIEFITNSVIKEIEHSLPQRSDLRSKIEVSNLDPRLNLSPCQGNLDLQLPPTIQNQQKFSVKVSCHKPQPWSVYVPVNLRYFGPVVTATRHLSRNQVISSQDIQIQEMEITRLNTSYFASVSQVDGMIVKRPWRAGQALHPNMLRLPHLVKRGESVMIVAKNPRVNIRMKGKALMPGAKGDRIRVKNTSSKRTVEAIVIARGIVKVAL